MQSSATSPISKWIGLIAVTAAVVIGGLTWSLWSPPAQAWVQQIVTAFRGSPPVTDGVGEGEADPHAGHAADNKATSLELSAQALKNIGLSPETIRAVELQTFRKSLTVPAAIVERPGRSRVQVATPMTGVVTHVHAVQGEAVEPGTLLFQIRLTHEDLVQAQSQFVRTLGELDVEQREIDRLTPLTRTGAVAGKTLLERQYAKDKLNAMMRSQREALRLHGLSEQQVDQIATGRRLLRELQIFAPSIDEHSDEELKLIGAIGKVDYVRDEQDTPPDQAHVSPLVLQDLNVHKGQSVTAGETLCILADYDALFIEGLAFEQDIGQLRKASQQGWTVDALFDEPNSVTQVIPNLRIAYLDNRVDVESRSLRFYVHLPNTIANDQRANGNRYIEWRYLPGQRLQLRVPVEVWPDQIVVPIEAVAREGAETFVFQQNGDHFDRVPVHVKYQDQHAAVIDNDGSIFPGDVVAMRGAHQMQMALKNKAGGGVDPARRP